MDAIIIPAAVVNSTEYAELTTGDKMFLIDLYICMQDIERFTINISHPEEYRQSEGVGLARRIQHLITAGFLIVDGQRKTACTKERIFRFKHSPIERAKLAA